jgi:hypothetical protein
MRPKHLVATALAIAAATAGCAQNPFVGKWKMDASKSRITGAIDRMSAD